MKSFLRVSILRALTALPVLCLLSLFTLALPGAVAANPACGDTLETADGLTTLDADLNCSDTGSGDAALYLIGSAALDMNGFTITCGDPNDDSEEVEMDGVHLKGTKNSLSNGAIVNCSDGVEVTFLSGGGARVTMVHVTGGWDDGFDLNGDGNKLSQVTASDNAEDGFDLDGDKNQLLNAIAYANGSSGVSISGNKNKLKFVTSYDNDFGGFSTSGDKNSLSNVSSVNDFLGFNIGGVGNKIKSSHAVGTDPFDGVAITGVKNKLSGVVVLASGRDGVHIQVIPFGEAPASGNKLSQLFVADSGLHGIRLEESVGNTVQGSTAVLSSSTDAYDTQSATIDQCVNNWKDNHFATSYPAACIWSGVDTAPLR
jgi:hypothetical protein